MSEIANDDLEETPKQPCTQTSTTVYGQSTHYFTQQQQQQQPPTGLVSLSGISSTTTTSSSVSFNGSSNGGYHHYQQIHQPPKQCVSFAQPVDEWSCESVAQWLAINDLAAYIDSFLDKSINGEKLIAMDTSKLKVRIISHSKS